MKTNHNILKKVLSRFRPQHVGKYNSFDIFIKRGSTKNELYYKTIDVFDTSPHKNHIYTYRTIGIYLPKDADKTLTEIFENLDVDLRHNIDDKCYIGESSIRKFKCWFNRKL